jgi:transcriptional regulator with XRE-family HTH domain
MATLASRPTASAIQITVRGAGGLIRELREKKSLQAKELAQLSGIDPSVLSKIENNLLGLSTDMLNKIAPVLGINPIDFASKCLDQLRKTNAAK